MTGVLQRCDNQNTKQPRIELDRNKSVLKGMSRYLEERSHEDLVSLKTKCLAQLFSIWVRAAGPEFSALQKFLLFGIKEVWIVYFATLVTPGSAGTSLVPGAGSPSN